MKIPFPLAAESLSDLPFTFCSYLTSFHQSSLGLIYLAIPWEDLVSSLGLVESELGRPSLFSPQGKLALMFLKHYCGCSDQRLLEQLNGNIHFQLFCGICIDPAAPLLHRQLVSRIRTELAELLSIEEAQEVLAAHWRPYLSAEQTAFFDATCYESEVRYPTDVKLLYESVRWLYGLLRALRRSLSLPMVRSKYRKWMARYDLFRRQRKPRKRRQRQMKRGLLRLLAKLLTDAASLISTHQPLMNEKEGDRLNLLERIYEQQKIFFETGQKPTGRIISLAKPYLRPIVRGKHNKPVEFGAKVHKIMLGGISFIEKISFDAFHEGIRLKQALFTARKLAGKIERIGADQIYATNDNRSYCTQKNIQTDFVPKGRKGKLEEQKKVIRKAIKKERVSRLEGSFGNEKNAFHLRKVRARTQKNEIFWIFIGMHTANALQIGKRIEKQA